MNIPKNFAAGIVGLTIACQPTTPAESPESKNIVSTYQHPEDHTLSADVTAICIEAQTGYKNVTLNIENVPNTPELKKLCTLMTQYEDSMTGWMRRAMMDEEANLQREDRGIPLIEPDHVNNKRMIKVAHIYHNAYKAIETAIYINRQLPKTELDIIQSGIEKAEADFKKGL